MLMLVDSLLSFWFLWSWDINYEVVY